MRLIKRVVDIIFFKNTWSISYFFLPLGFHNLPDEINIDKDQINIANSADPFFFLYKNIPYLIYEKISTIGNKGYICLLNLETRNEKLVLKTKYNLSFPSIHHINNEIILICECSESKELKFWKLNNNFQAVEEKNIINEPILDPVLLTKDKNFYLIGSLRNKKNDYRPTIYKSQDFINWSKFEDANIYINKGDERNAGQPYFIENNIYRFSQILEPKYGSGIKMHRVSQNEPSAYKETLTKEIRMSKISKSDGIHTISFDKNGFYYDFRMRTFNLFAIFYKFIALLRKKYIKLSLAKT
jgi:hypothetical protein